MGLDKSLRNFGLVLTALFLSLQITGLFPRLITVPMVEVAVWVIALAALWAIFLRNSSENRILLLVWSTLYTGFFLFTILTLSSEILAYFQVSMLFLVGVLNFWFATERVEESSVYYKATLANLPPFAAYFFIDAGFFTVAALTQGLPILMEYRRKSK